MEPLMEMRIKMENKGPLLSSRPHSLLSAAVCEAGLFSLTGCESHETGGHQGPGPPRQHAPPQSAARSTPQPSPCLHTNNLLHHFKYFIPQAPLSLPLPHIFISLASIMFFFLSNTPPHFSLPSSGPLILSHLHVFCCLVVMLFSFFWPPFTHHFSQTELRRRVRKKGKKVRGCTRGGESMRAWEKK